MYARCLKGGKFLPRMSSRLLKKEWLKEKMERLFWASHREKRNFAPGKPNTRLEMTLPKDPMMLYSLVNMKLRDEYATLDALCDGMDVDRTELERHLAEAGFEYNPAQNKFW